MKDLKKELELAEKEFEDVKKSYMQANNTLQKLEVLGLKIQGKIEALKNLLAEPEKKELKEVK